MKTLTSIQSLLAAGLLSLSACATHHDQPQHPPSPPVWTLNPKLDDSVNMYRVGTAQKASPAEARAAAYRDALRQLAEAVYTEAGIPLPGEFPVPFPVRGAEIMPGCSHLEQGFMNWTAWVQVSYPLTEKQRMIENLRDDQRRPAR